MIDVNKAKQKILDLALQGKFTEQLANDGNAQFLYEEIIRERESQGYKAKVNKKIERVDEEILSDVPHSWLLTYVENIAFVTKLAGFEYTKFIANNLTETGVPLFKGKNIQENRLLLEFESYIPMDVSNSLPRSQLNKKCLLVPYVGTIGNIAIFDGSFKAHLGSNVGKIEFYNRNDKKFILEEFALIFFKSKYGYLELTKHKKATAQESISINAIRDVVFPLPTINEQKQIVAIVGELFKLIDKMDEAQKKYEKDKEVLKSKIIEAGIRGKLTKQLKSDGNASDLLDEIRKEKEKLIKEGKIKRDKKETYIYKNPKDNLYYEKYQDGTEKCINDELPFKISENWTWAKFSNVCDIATGTSIPKKVKADKYLGLNKGYCYIGTKDVGFDHKIIYENSVKIPKGEKGFEIAPENSVLLCIEGGSAGRKIGIIDRDVCYGNKLCKFYSHSLNQRYIYYFLQSDTFKSIFKNNLTGLIEGVSISSINNLLIPLPPMKEQERIAKVIEKILSIINN